MQEHVIHELSLMASLSMSSRSSVDREPARCSGIPGSASVITLDFIINAQLNVIKLSSSLFRLTNDRFAFKV